MTDTTERHASDELCFFCAPDDVLVAALPDVGGQPSAQYQGPRIHWQRPESFCPNLTTHVVMDSSDNPECIDDCPGCESRGDGDR